MSTVIADDNGHAQAVRPVMGLMQREREYYVERVMAALEALARDPLTTPRLAQLLQIHPRTARRLLKRLTTEGYLTRTTTRTGQGFSAHVFSPSPRLVALARQITDRWG